MYMNVREYMRAFVCECSFVHVCVYFRFLCEGVSLPIKTLQEIVVYVRFYTGTHLDSFFVLGVFFSLFSSQLSSYL